MQSLPSSHGVLSAAGVPAQVPFEQVSLLVHEFWSSQAAPSSGAGSPAQVPFVQASLAVQAFWSSQALPFGLKVSAGQETLVPVQVSATSQEPAAARQTVPAAASG